MIVPENSREFLNQSDSRLKTNRNQVTRFRGFFTLSLWYFYSLWKTIFDWVPQVIRVCFGFPLLRSVSGPENLHPYLTPSHAITWLGHPLFPCFWQFACFFLSSHRIVMMLVFVFDNQMKTVLFFFGLPGCWDCFRLGFTKLRRNVLYITFIKPYFQ